MIQENQKLLNRLNVLSDGVLIYLMLPLAYWLRFHVLPGGVVSVPFPHYLRLDLFITLMQLFTYAAMGVYQTSRKIRLGKELERLLIASLLDLALLLSWLFIGRGTDYSRWTLAIFFLFSVGMLAFKRLIFRKLLRAVRQSGKNFKRVLVVGAGETAKRYLDVISTDRELGYETVGYVAGKAGTGISVPYLGGIEALEKVLERTRPDEVVSAIETDDYKMTPHIIECCETSGIKLSIIPFYVDYMPTHPQFDDLNGIPLMNIRRIPLDNFANAFVKRTMDVVGALFMLVLSSPILLISAIGIKLTSPGPVLFRQIRVGRYRKQFRILKLRTMRLNSESDSAWSQDTDARRTKFGALLRKLSIDELVQCWNVLKGDMSLVGPRPEIPHFVDQFKTEIPLYMVRHQVRPGITGWAQINGFRGDTPIKERVEHDIYYIENWSLWFDIRILMATVFKGKFINEEQI